MSKVIIVCSEVNFDLTKIDFDFTIGVEQGAMALINQNIVLDYACGDFDHVSEQQFNIIKKHAKKIDVYDQVNKDKLDGELAIMYAITKGYKEIWFIINGYRFDFHLTNYFFINKYNIKFLTDYCLAYKLNQAVNIIDANKYKDYQYVSLLGENSVINIKNMKYNVENFILTYSNALSNEFISDSLASIEVVKGNVIIVFSKENFDW